MGSNTLNEIEIIGKIGVAILNFVVGVAPLVAQLWG